MGSYSPSGAGGGMCEAPGGGVLLKSVSSCASMAASGVGSSAKQTKIAQTLDSTTEETSETEP